MAQGISANTTAKSRCGRCPGRADAPGHPTPWQGGDGRPASEKSGLRRQQRCRGRIRAKQTPNTDTDYRSNSSAPSPPYGRDTRGCHPIAARQGIAHSAKIYRAAPLSTGLWHCTAYPVSSGSHLGSTLKPGGAVLTLGVFRRSGSVAFVRADASPSEVLARSC